MSLPEFDAHAAAALDKFQSLLPRSEDASLVILKLHLLVEVQVRAFVDERLPNSQALEAAQLECHQAISLAEALSTEDIHPNVWEAARKLNTLRNQIAHHLEPKGVVDRMRNIARLAGLPPELEKIDGKTPEAAALANLIFSVMMLHSEISLYVKKRPASILKLVGDESDA
jgi:hypothetical protein